ncbi:MarR family winged helix-turn-helix transcriptional regulator [Streptomyces sp. WAC07061]|uniref:MarR family winged helix-turn-helix transcriptional regulator n=1 Tax=Streptomyces sp. WAC07061 TaxID=2487410 RepID=UPI0021AF0269|nr:MarR family transcriptional regulator [Streptomyces sp. WAC07061]
MDTPPQLPTTDPAPAPGPRGAAFLLAQIGAHAASRFAERVGHLGLVPADVGLLRTIATRPGRSQRALAEDLGVVPSRVVTLIDNLEGKGLVERRRSAEDRRNYELHLTAEGTRTLGAVSRAAAAHEDALLAALDPQQRTYLSDLLARVATEQGLTPGVHPGYRNRG